MEIEAIYERKYGHDKAKSGTIVRFCDRFIKIFFFPEKKVSKCTFNCFSA